MNHEPQSKLVSKPSHTPVDINTEPPFDEAAELNKGLSWDASQPARVILPILHLSIILI
jgi:hypothetical protein